MTRLATAALPGLRLELVDQPWMLPPGPSAGVRLLGPARGLIRTDLPEDLSTVILAALGGLRGAETVVLQWLISPLKTPRRRLAPQTKADELKRGEFEVVAAGRIAGVAGTNERARVLVDRLARLLRQSKSDTGGFRLRWSQLVARDVRQRRPPIWIWPSHLNVNELLGVVGLPVGEAWVPGLTRGISRVLAPANDAPGTGPVVGRTNYPGRSRQIRLGGEGRLRHLHLIGPTGVGKSTVLARAVLSDIAAGTGLVIVDPLGDLTDRIAERIPTTREPDLMIVDPTDALLPVGFNLLQTTKTAQAVEFVIGVMSRLFAASWGPRTADILRAGLLTLAANRGTTMVELPGLLTNPAQRRRLVPVIQGDPLLAGFWQWFDDLSTAERANVIAPLMNKLRSWLLRPEVVRTICHPVGTLNFTDVFTNRKIVILRLPKGLLSQEISALIGGLLLASLWRAVLARAAVPADRRRPVFIYLDEFQDFLRLPLGLGDLLAQARGLGVGVVLAHQHLGQLTDDVRRDVLGTVGSRMIFRLGADDARIMSRDLEPFLSAADLKGLGSREIVASVALPDRILPPATGRTEPLPPPTRDPRLVRAAAAQRFGRAMPTQEPEPAELPIGRKRRGEEES